MRDRTFYGADETYCDIVKLTGLLQEEPDLLDCRDSTRGTLLDIASRAGRKDIVIWLLSKGADPCTVAPLRQAVSAGDKEIVELLHSKGAPVDDDILVAACFSGRSDMMEFLLTKVSEI